MSDFEDRLSAWGATEAAAAGPHPPLSLVRRRRWQPLAAAAGVILLVGGVAFAVAQGREDASRPSPGRVASSSAAVAADVPWADLPPGPSNQPSALPVATADPSVRACQAADLRATHAGTGEGGGGNWFDRLALTNASPTPCRLTGRLEGLSGINAGARRTITVRSDAHWFGDVPVVLRPGESGQVSYSFYPRCDQSPAVGDTIYRHLRLTLLGGTLDVSSRDGSDVLDLGCSSPSVGISAGQLGGVPAEPSYAPEPVHSLTVSLRAPGAATAGAVLRYVVEVHNGGAADVALDPCPNFLQALGSNVVKDPHSLNCADAHPVPAHGSETFAMELVVPADAPSGETGLSWYLDGATSGHASTTVSVEGGTDPGGSADTCNPSSKAVPCVSGMEVGKSDKYTIETHCGIREVYANGQFWVPNSGQALDDGSGNPPAGVDNPFDTGTVVLAKPGVALEWTSRRGVRYRFRPRTPSDPPVSNCE